MNSWCIIKEIWCSEYLPESMSLSLPSENLAFPTVIEGVLSIRIIAFLFEFLCNIFLERHQLFMDPAAAFVSLDLGNFIFFFIVKLYYCFFFDCIFHLFIFVEFICQAIIR